jgi:hypothetical protein
VEANIPLTRSGSAYGTSCDGRLIVAGGERSISGRVDIFDGTNWQTFANGLNDSRHGTGLAVDCIRNKIYIASGAPNNGGGQTTSLEIYTPAWFQYFMKNFVRVCCYGSDNYWYRQHQDPTLYRASYVATQGWFSKQHNEARPDLQEQCKGVSLACDNYTRRAVNIPQLFKSYYYY